MKVNGILKKILGTAGYVIVKNIALNNLVKDKTTRNLVSTGVDAVIGFTNIVPAKMQQYISKEYLQIKTGSNLLKTAMETNKTTAAYVQYIQEENSLIQGEDDFFETMQNEENETSEEIQGEEAFMMGEEFSMENDGTATMQGEEPTSLI